MFAVLVLDLDRPGWPVAACSDDVCALTGFSREELLGRPWSALWKGDRDKGALKVLEQAIDRGQAGRVPLCTPRRERPPLDTAVEVHFGRDGRGAVALLQIDVGDDVGWLAYHDPLTGLPNRRLFERDLDLAVTRAIRHDLSVAVLFLDLDDFKPINDQLGHEAGDEVLRQTAERLRGAVRSEDMVARLGGDEFVVVLGDVDGPPAQHAAAVTAHLQAAMREAIELPAGPRRIGLSIGTSVFPGDGSDASQLLAVADASMYRLKRGRLDAARAQISQTGHALLERARAEQRRANELRVVIDDAVATSTALRAAGRARRDSPPQPHSDRPPPG